MKQTWKIDLSTQRKLRDHYLKEEKFEVADSIEHTSSKYEGLTIELLTIEELNSLKENNPETSLISIFGEDVLAKDADDDTRAGCVAYGKQLR